MTEKFLLSFSVYANLHLFANQDLILEIFLKDIIGSEKNETNRKEIMAAIEDLEKINGIRKKQLGLNS